MAVEYLLLVENLLVNVFLVQSLFLGSIIKLNLDEIGAN